VSEPRKTCCLSAVAELLVTINIGLLLLLRKKMLSPFWGHVTSSIKDKQGASMLQSRHAMQLAR